MCVCVLAASICPSGIKLAAFWGQPFSSENPLFLACSLTCLILNCVCHWNIACYLKRISNFFRIGLFVKIKEPTVLGINMFSAPSLTLKSIMVTLLYWAVIQAVGFILFQVKPFRFGWCPIDIRPIDFALLAHFAFSRGLGRHDLL